MKNIKSFIYLDNYKMYSISSQLFEGLTEYMVQSRGKTYSENESQKGRIGSGKLMADILEEYSNHSEKKFLHDYSYTLFEDELISSNRVLSIDKENIDSSIEELENYHFVKITGQTVFNDSKMLAETLSKFNDFGAALGLMGMQEKQNQLDEWEEQVAQIKDRNKRAKAKRQLSKVDMKKYLLKEGLNLDDRFLEKLVYLINHGYKSQFEVQLPFPSEIENYLFSCIINRDFLKDDEYRLIRKYSRETEKPFTLFGIVTQSKRTLDERTTLETLKENINFQNSIDGKESNVKEALLSVIPALTGIDKGFIGRLDYEYIVDPIAIYREL